MSDYREDRAWYEKWLYEYTRRNPKYRAQLERLEAGELNFRDFLSDVIDVECGGVDVYRCRYQNHLTGEVAEETYRPYLAPTVKAVSGSESGQLSYRVDPTASQARVMRDMSVAKARAHGQPMPDEHESGQYDAETIRERPRATFPVREDDCRILGLELWDHIDAHGGSVLSAIRALRQTTTYLDIADGRKNQDISDRQLIRFYNHTEACIEACEVLPFSNKK